MSKDTEGLKKRERLFCQYFVSSADAVQSALRAGYRLHPEQKAAELLSRSDVESAIASMSKHRRRVMSHVAYVLYEKLAFSGIADAVSLLYMDKVSKADLQNMDLCMVSEIKKPKDGALEIKFVDRLKALSGLCTTNSDDKNSASTLMDALDKGAQNLSDCIGDSDEL